MAGRSVSSPGWPWPVVVILALITLAVVLFVPLLLFLLVPVAAIAMIVWGYVAYRDAPPGARSKPAAAMAGGVALLILCVLLISGLTIVTSSVEVQGPVSAPATPQER